MKIPLLLASLALFASACEKPPRVARARSTRFAGGGLGPPVPLTAAQAHAKWTDVKAPATMDAGKSYSAQATIQNDGSAGWVNMPPGLNGLNTVRVSYHWNRPDGTVVVFDGVRTDLPQPVGPGESVRMAAIQVTAPPAPGDYRLVFDILQEGVRWLNSSPAPIPVTVR
jgi:hypothetical protein